MPYAPRFLLPLIAAFGWIAPATAQPLFFLGSAEAKLQGAFSFGFLRSPLDYPEHRGEILFDFNVPVSLAGRGQELVGDASDSSVVVPGFFGQIGQLMNAGVSGSGKVGPGILIFAARENAGLRVAAALGDAAINLDTTLGMGTLRLQGSVFLPLLLEMRWRSMTLGYVFRLAPWMRAGLQLQRHEVMASVGGDLRPDMAGRVAVEGLAFDIGYSDAQVYGNATGQYRGVAYGPEIAVEAGTFRWVFRMPVSLRAEGNLDMRYSVPFFINPETFENEISAPESLMTATNLRRLQSGETRSRAWIFREPLRFSLPGSHTFAYRMLRGHLEFSYTAFSGSLGSRAFPLPASPDSLALQSKGFLNANLSPDHLLLFRWETPFFHGCVGAHAINFDYRGKANLLSDLSPLQLFGDPLAPVLQLGFSWGDPLRLNVDLALVPLPFLRGGLRYWF